MREILLSFLRCPKCKRSSFSIIKNELSQFEIRSGKIQCCSCGVSYQILNGIIDFLKDTNENVIRERKAMDDDKYIIDEAGNKYRIADETIQMFKHQFLSLPEGDGSYFFKRGGSFQSFAEASDRFYATLDRLSLTGSLTP